MSSPSTRICPLSGLSRPMRCFISTDLPCPEPPMMMLIWPRTTSRSTPFKTSCGPNDFLIPRILIWMGSRSLIVGSADDDAAPRAADSIYRSDSLRSSVLDRQNDVGEEVVEHQDGDEAADHRARGADADALGAAGRVVALIAADERERGAEHGRLDHALRDVFDVDDPLGVLQEHALVDAFEQHRDAVAAEHADGVEQHRQKR